MANAAAQAGTNLDLEHFREILEQERKRILDQIRHIDAQNPDSDTANELDELANYDQHQADQATVTFLREQDQAIYTGLRAELEQVDAATERLEEGRFGICERCGADIPEERLEVLPFAPFCIKCAGDVEARL